MSYKGTPSILKSVNRQLVEEYARSCDMTTKPQIAAATNLSLVTVTKIVNAMVDEGILQECGTADSTGGRQAVCYRINPMANYFICINHTEEEFTCAMVDAAGSVVRQEKLHLKESGTDKLFEKLCDAIDSFGGKNGGQAPKAIGIGLPGVTHEGKVSSIPRIPDWEDYPLAQMLVERYPDTSVLLENDINLAALGLHRRRYKGKFRNLVLIYLERGVGAGLIINRQLYQGKSHFAGEIGYLPVFRKGMPAPVMMEQAVRKVQDRRELIGIVKDCLVNVVCIFNPEAVVLCGRGMNQEDADGIRKYVSDTLGAANTPEISTLSDLSKYCIEGLIHMCRERTGHGYAIARTNRREI